MSGSVCGNKQLPGNLKDCHTHVVMKKKAFSFKLTYHKFTIKCGNQNTIALKQNDIGKIKKKFTIIANNRSNNERKGREIRNRRREEKAEKKKKVESI